MKTFSPFLTFWLLVASATGMAVAKPDAAQVHVEITGVSKASGSLHWKITNTSPVEIYVYDFFLLGPAFRVEHNPDRVVFDTSPTTEEASCPPDRFPPVLLLVIRSGGVVEGEFSDGRIKDLSGKAISLKIAAGSEPYSVVAEAKRLMASGRCEHSPYDAIVRWATIVESNAWK